MASSERAGDYAHAEQRYQAALATSKKLGDRATVATITSNIGALRTEQGRPAEVIPFNIDALRYGLSLRSQRFPLIYSGCQEATGRRRRKLH
jgi:hypothetical protein